MLHHHGVQNVMILFSGHFSLILQTILFCRVISCLQVYIGYKNLPRNRLDFSLEFFSNTSDSHKQMGGRSAITFGLDFSHATGIRSILKKQRRESDVQRKPQAAAKEVREGMSCLDATLNTHCVLIVLTVLIVIHSMCRPQHKCNQSREKWTWNVSR